MKTQRKYPFLLNNCSLRLLTQAIVALVVILCNDQMLNAQCFVSPGNPIAGTVNVGVLQIGTWRGSAMFKHSLQGVYFEGSQRKEVGLISDAHFNYVSATLGFGLTRRLTLETEAGYFINKAWRYAGSEQSSRGYGLANAVFTAKYLLHHDLQRDFEFSGGVGVSIPFSTGMQTQKGVSLPIELQPSTGNYALILQTFLMKEYPDASLRLFQINRAEIRMNENQSGYRFGNSYYASMFISRHLYSPLTRITRDMTAIIQLRYQYNGQNLLGGQVIDHSGSHQVFIAPQLNYNPAEIWNFSLIAEIPVYQYYNGIQLGHTFGAAFVVTLDLGH
jgi:hypothetical protein